MDSHSTARVRSTHTLSCNGGTDRGIRAITAPPPATTAGPPPPAGETVAPADATPTGHSRRKRFRFDRIGGHVALIPSGISNALVSGCAVEPQ